MQASRPASHRATLGAKPVEGLRARHLVDQVQVDVDEVGLTVFALHDQVVVPDLLSQGSGVIGNADIDGGFAHELFRSRKRWFKPATKLRDGDGLRTRTRRGR